MTFIVRVEQLPLSESSQITRSHTQHKPRCEQTIFVNLGWQRISISCLGQTLAAAQHGQGKKDLTYPPTQTQNLLKYPHKSHPITLYFLENLLFQATCSTRSLFPCILFSSIFSIIFFGRCLCYHSIGLSDSFLHSGCNPPFLQPPLGWIVFS